MLISNEMHEVEVSTLINCDMYIPTKLQPHSNVSV